MGWAAFGIGGVIAFGRVLRSLVRGIEATSRSDVDSASSWNGFERSIFPTGS